MSTRSEHTWLTKLKPYDYEIQYKHGELNVVVDVLLRITSFEVTLQALHRVSTDLFERIQATWEND